MADWKPGPDLIQCLWHGLFNEEFENRRAAGRALVVASQKDTEFAHRLFKLVCAPVEAGIAASALSTLFEGWPTYPGLDVVIEQARNSRVPVLKVTAIRCAVGLGKVTADDPNTLLRLADTQHYLFSPYGGDLVRALAEGWSDDDKLFDICLRSAGR